MADRHRDGALARHHVAAGEDSGGAGHHVGSNDHRAVAVERDAGRRAQEAAVGVLAERQHHRVGLQGFELAGRLREAVRAELHHLHRQRAFGDILDGGQPLDLDAFGQRLVGLEFVRGHVGAVTAIDDQRFFRAQPARGARRVHRGVAAAIDHHAAAEQRLFPRADLAQQGDRVQHPRRVAGRDVDMLRDMRADRDEHGVEVARLLFRQQVGHLVVQHDPHAHRLDARDFAHQVGARQPVGGNAEMQHAAGSGPASWISTKWPSRVR